MSQERPDKDHNDIPNRKGHRRSAAFVSSDSIANIPALMKALESEVFKRELQDLKSGTYPNKTPHSKGQGNELETSSPAPNRAPYVHGQLLAPISEVPEPAEEGEIENEEETNSLELLSPPSTFFSTINRSESIPPPSSPTRTSSSSPTRSASV